MEYLLAGLSGGLIGAVLSFIISFLTLRFNYRQLFAETVSKNRMEWINVWRENIAIFLSRAQALREKEKQTHGGCRISRRFKKSNQDDSTNLETELYKARSMITMRLNMEEEPHILMYGALMNFDWKMKDDLDFKKQCEVVEQLAREILKPEWERVKKEAKGRR